jgi:hypothetical protein
MGGGGGACDAAWLVAEICASIPHHTHSHTHTSCLQLANTGNVEIIPPSHSAAQQQPKPSKKRGGAAASDAWAFSQAVEYSGDGDVPDDLIQAAVTGSLAAQRARAAAGALGHEGSSGGVCGGFTASFSVRLLSTRLPATETSEAAAAAAAAGGVAAMAAEAGVDVEGVTEGAGPMGAAAAKMKKKSGPSSKRGASAGKGSSSSSGQGRSSRVESGAVPPENAEGGDSSSAAVPLPMRSSSALRRSDSATSNSGGGGGAAPQAPPTKASDVASPYHKRSRPVGGASGAGITLPE